MSQWMIWSKRRPLTSRMNCRRYIDIHTSIYIIHIVSTIMMISHSSLTFIVGRLKLRLNRLSSSSSSSSSSTSTSTSSILHLVVLLLVQLLVTQTPLLVCETVLLRRQSDAKPWHDGRQRLLITFCSKLQQHLLRRHGVELVVRACGDGKPHVVSGDLAPWRGSGTVRGP